jgi:hypothetical protein
LREPGGIAVGYRQESIGETVFEPFGGKPSKTAGAKYSYTPWRKNFGKQICG